MGSGCSGKCGNGRTVNTNSSREIIMNGIFKNNPILIQVLGICSTLAVTNVLKNTVVMGVALIFVCSFSSLIVSLLRKLIPSRVRMMAEILIIATGVILVDIVLKAHLPEVSRQLGPFVGLIITNCIVMGRCEAYALANPPYKAAVDGASNAAGYAIVLIVIAIIRELLGSGSLWGIQIMGDWWINWSIMVMAPGGFFVLAILLWTVKGIFKEKSENG
ncbi:MAG TPA: NADH:ubiquinone reductase (Na(+)-transporting) subunit D [Victivallales bacterium]|nr:NADH:ubiquinone reductase (Na(+)-transporting) subunit D [Victivallales bacterium]